MMSSEKPLFAKGSVPIELYYRLPVCRDSVGFLGEGGPKAPHMVACLPGEEESLLELEMHTLLPLVRRDLRARDAYKEQGAMTFLKKFAERLLEVLQSREISNIRFQNYTGAFAMGGDLGLLEEIATEGGNGGLDKKAYAEALDAAHGFRVEAVSSDIAAEIYGAMLAGLLEKIPEELVRGFSLPVAEHRAWFEETCCSEQSLPPVDENGDPVSVDDEDKEEGDEEEPDNGLGGDAHWGGDARG